MKHLKKFETLASLTAAMSGSPIPFVGMAEDGGTTAVRICRLMPSDEIWYTSSDGNTVTPYDANVFGANITSNIYTNGKGVIKFDGPVTGIGDYAFRFCGGLTSVTIPSSVTSIGGYTFMNCTGLTSIDIPSGVTSIGYNAFYGCTGLTSIAVSSANTTYDSRGGCNAVIETATNTLVVGCRNTVIPDTVTSIGSNAFLNCSALTSVTIPSSVTSIGDSAFAGCSGLTSVTIPSGVTSIGMSAFSSCSSFTSIVCEPTTPPTAGNISVFGSTNNCPIYVPSESVDTYKAANVWKNYASRISAILG